jgi:hypothetical protein
VRFLATCLRAGRCSVGAKVWNGRGVWQIGGAYWRAQIPSPISLVFVHMRDPL